MTTLTHLECSQCGRQYDPAEPHGVCSCGGPLLARYDLEAARRSWSREWIRSGPDSMWRWAPVLPVRKPPSLITLGEGLSPFLHAGRLGAALGLANLWVKDEGVSPTGSFKARGACCAVSMANELGLRALALPSAGNAGSAIAAYAAAAGMEAHVFLPADVPAANWLECRAFGAQVTLVDGNISDCGRLASERAAAEGWFDVSTFKEPYRVEGKKTIGFEIAEHLGWQPPDAIVFPTGGGVGLVGIWKAFEELGQLEWIAARRPKMIAVQAAGCAPLARAFEQGAERAETWSEAFTLASGLRVPGPFADALVLRVIRQSGGTALAVSDAEMLDGARELARLEGVFAAPEGGACVAALRKLLAAGTLQPDERIVMVNTAGGLKYAEAWSTRLPRRYSSEQDKLGGLITPR